MAPLIRTSFRRAGAFCHRGGANMVPSSTGFLSWRQDNSFKCRFEFSRPPSLVIGGRARPAPRETNKSLLRPASPTLLGAFGPRSEAGMGFVCGMAWGIRQCFRYDAPAHVANDGEWSYLCFG